MPRTRMLGVLLALLVFAGAAQARNPQIAGLQVALKTRGFYKARIDAIAGPATAEALRRFQRRAGLKVDGLAGSRTRAALGRLGRPLYGARVLQRGNVGWDVSVLQFLLAWRGYRPGKIDGHFGHRTAVVLRRFQRRSGLKPDAIAGRLTLSRLCAWSSCMPSRVAPGPAYRRYVVRWGTR